MKTLLMALAATTIAATPIISAQAEAAPQREVHREIHQGPHGRVVEKTVITRNGGNQYRPGQNRADQYRPGQRWAKGQRFDRRYATNYRVIDNPRAYRLNAAPRGYRWVRSGNDAVLIAITGGLIGAVVGNAIR